MYGLRDGRNNDTECLAPGSDGRNTDIESIAPK
jgi:hypothetical protein